MLDQSSDANRQFFHLLTNQVDSQGAKLVEVPDFVKSAEDASLSGLSANTGNGFLDPTQRRLYCGTKAAAWMSAVYLYGQKDHIQPHRFRALEDRLEKLADLHGMASEIDQIKQSFARSEKVESLQLADSDYAFVTPKSKAVPIVTPNQVKQACEYLKTYRNDLSWTEARDMAKRILAKCASLNLKPDSDTEAMLEKYCGLAICDPDRAELVVSSRIAKLHRIGRTKEAEEMQQLALSIQENDIDILEDAVKIAEAVDEVDQEFGFGPDLPSIDSMFVFTEKQAAEILDQHVQLVTGAIYKKADLSKIPLQKLRDVFGAEFASQVSPCGLFVDAEKLAEQLSVLPRPDCRDFEELADGLSVAPVEKQASVTGPVRLTQTDLQKLAAMRV